MLVGSLEIQWLLTILHMISATVGTTVNVQTRTILKVMLKNSEMEWGCSHAKHVKLDLWGHNAIWSLIQCWFRGNDSKVKSKIIEYYDLPFSEYVQQERWDIPLPKQQQYWQYTWWRDSSFSFSLSKWAPPSCIYSIQVWDR